MNATDRTEGTDRTDKPRLVIVRSKIGEAEARRAVAWGVKAGLVHPAAEKVDGRSRAARASAA